ncbi:MAG: polar amino acid transport system substrate-binding protein [Phenylobacterium sp.]|jgi:polar amino acid transport system substrate-binding protein
MPRYCCYLLILMCLNTVANSCELTVRTYIFPPLAMKDKDNQWQGMDIETTKALLDMAGCRFSFIDMPWARGLRMVKQGQIDAILNVTKTKERAEYLYFVGPQRYEEVRFVSKKGLFAKVKTWQQLEGLEATLMRQQGTFKGERLAQLFAGMMYLSNQIRTNPAFAVVEIHPLVINKDPVYFAFSKASMSSEDMKKIYAAYDQLAKAKTLEVITKRYTDELL